MLPKVDLVDAVVGWQFGRHVKFNAIVSNVGDVIAARTATGVNGVWSTEPRTFRFTVKWEH
jgi:outer membrane receptor protein involved in Fe transport